jgi:hypothetical protein
VIRPEPVVVVHLDTAEGAGLTACTGDPFRPDDGISYPTTPRVACTGCTRAAMNGSSYRLPGNITLIITNEQTIISRRPV